MIYQAIKTKEEKEVLLKHKRVVAAATVSKDLSKQIEQCSYMVDNLTKERHMSFVQNKPAGVEISNKYCLLDYTSTKFIYDGLLQIDYSALLTLERLLKSIKCAFKESTCEEKLNYVTSKDGILVFCKPELNERLGNFALIYKGQLVATFQYGRSPLVYLKYMPSDPSFIDEFLSSLELVDISEVALPEEFTKKCEKARDDYIELERGLDTVTKIFKEIVRQLATINLVSKHYLSIHTRTNGKTIKFYTARSKVLPNSRSSQYFNIFIDVISTPGIVRLRIYPGEFAYPTMPEIDIMSRNGEEITEQLMSEKILQLTTEGDYNGAILMLVEKIKGLPNYNSEAVVDEDDVNNAV